MHHLTAYAVCLWYADSGTMQRVAESIRGCIQLLFRDRAFRLLACVKRHGTCHR